MSQESGNSTSFDAGRQQVGRVYAQALLAAAEKQGQADDTVAELTALVSDVLDRLPEFDSALASPRIPHEEKIVLLEKAFSGRVSKTLLDFLKVVSRHGRLDCVREIVQQARTLLNNSLGRVEVTVTTAEPIDSQLLKSVGDQLRQTLGSEIDLQTRVDGEIIGGMVVRVGDTVYDGSVANNFIRLREQALEKTAQEIRRSVDRFTSG